MAEGMEAMMLVRRTPAKVGLRRDRSPIRQLLRPVETATLALPYLFATSPLVSQRGRVMYRLCRFERVRVGAPARAGSALRSELRGRRARDKSHILISPSSPATARSLDTPSVLSVPRVSAWVASTTGSCASLSLSLSLRSPQPHRLSPR